MKNSFALHFCAGSGIRNKLFASFKIWINVDFLQNSVYNIDHATAAKVGPKSDKAAENTITSLKLFVPAYYTLMRALNEFKVLGKLLLLHVPKSYL